MSNTTLNVEKFVKLTPQPPTIAAIMAIFSIFIKQQQHGTIFVLIQNAYNIVQPLSKT